MPVVTRADRPVGGHWRSRVREIANACRHNREADRDQAPARRPTDQGNLWKCERQRQQAIEGNPEDKAGEIEEWRPRDDPRHRCFASPLASRSHVCSIYLPGNASKVRVGPR